MSNIMYYDNRTDRVKTAAHAHFDEERDDMDNPPPNVTQLKRALGKPCPSETHKGTPPKNLNLYSQDSLFTNIVDLKMRIKCDHEHLGFIIKNCSHCNRGYMKDITPKTTAAGIRGWKRKFAGGYIVQINDKPVFTQEEIEHALFDAQEASYTQDKPLISIFIVPDKEHTLQQHMLQIYIDKLRSVVSAINEIKHASTLDDDDDLTNDEILMAIT
eukprot:7935432-Ditylum_brightwellii.AAC.1